MSSFSSKAFAVIFGSLVLFGSFVQSQNKGFRGGDRGYGIDVEANSIGTNLRYKLPEAKAKSSNPMDWKVDNDNAEMQLATNLPLAAIVMTKNPKFSVKGSWPGYKVNLKLPKETKASRKYNILTGTKGNGLHLVLDNGSKKNNAFSETNEPKVNESQYNVKSGHRLINKAALGIKNVQKTTASQIYGGNNSLTKGESVGYKDLTHSKAHLISYNPQKTGQLGKLSKKALNNVDSNGNKNVPGGTLDSSPKEANLSGSFLSQNVQANTAKSTSYKPESSLGSYNSDDNEGSTSGEGNSEDEMDQVTNNDSLKRSNVAHVNKQKKPDKKNHIQQKDEDVFLRKVQKAVQKLKKFDFNDPKTRQALKDIIVHAKRVVLEAKTVLRDVANVVRSVQTFVAENTDQTLDDEIASMDLSDDDTSLVKSVQKASDDAESSARKADFSAKRAQAASKLAVQVVDDFWKVAKKSQKLSKLRDKTVEKLELNGNDDSVHESSPVENKSQKNNSHEAEESGDIDDDSNVENEISKSDENEVSFDSNVLSQQSVGLHSKSTGYKEEKSENIKDGFGIENNVDLAHTEEQSKYNNALLNNQKTVEKQNDVKEENTNSSEKADPKEKYQNNADIAKTISSILKLKVEKIAKKLSKEDNAQTPESKYIATEDAKALEPLKQHSEEVDLEPDDVDQGKKVRPLKKKVSEDNIDLGSDDFENAMKVETLKKIVASEANNIGTKNPVEKVKKVTPFKKKVTKDPDDLTREDVMEIAKKIMPIRKKESYQEAIDLDKTDIAVQKAKKIKLSKKIVPEEAIEQLNTDVVVAKVKKINPLKKAAPDESTIDHLDMDVVVEKVQKDKTLKKKVKEGTERENDDEKSKTLKAKDEEAKSLNPDDVVAQILKDQLKSNKFNPKATVDIASNEEKDNEEDVNNMDLSGEPAMSGSYDVELEVEPDKLEFTKGLGKMKEKRVRIKSASHSGKGKKIPQKKMGKILKTIRKVESILGFKVEKEGNSSKRTKTKTKKHHH